MSDCASGSPAGRHEACGECGELTRIIAAPVTGYMFGKGVYFADVSTRVLRTCFGGDVD